MPRGFYSPNTREISSHFYTYNQEKHFRFSHNPIDDTGALGQEYQYLLKNSYKWEAGTMAMKSRY